MTTTTLAASDQAIDRELARVSDSYRFLLDLTPVDVEANRDTFLHGVHTEPSFTYRDKLMEVNVFSVELHRHYGLAMDNRRLATL